MPRHLPRPLLHNTDEIFKYLDQVRKGDTLGDLIMWSVEEMEILPSELETLLAKHGIEKWAPVPIRTKTAARKAIIQVRKDLEHGDLRVLVRKVRENDEEVRYAIVDEQADRENAHLDYSLRNQVVFLKTVGELQFTKEEIPEIRERFERLRQVYTQREIVAMLRNIMLGYGGIPFRDGSGMFFMPVAVRRITDALRTLVNDDLNGQYGRAYFRPIGVVNSDESKDALDSVFRLNIVEDLSEAQEALSRVLSMEDVKSSSIRYALDRYREIENKARMYRDLLSVQVEEITDVIAAAKAKLEKLMGISDDDDDDNEN